MTHLFGEFVVACEVDTEKITALINAALDENCGREEQMKLMKQVEEEFRENEQEFLRRLNASLWQETCDRICINGWARYLEMHGLR